MAFDWLFELGGSPGSLGTSFNSDPVEPPLAIESAPVVVSAPVDDALAWWLPSPRLGMGSLPVMPVDDTVNDLAAWQLPPASFPAVSGPIASGFAGDGSLFGPAALPGRGFTHPVGKDLFYNPDTGEVVNAAGQRVIDRETLGLTADLIANRVTPEPSIVERIMKGLKPAEAFLGTNTGRVLAMLGLGAAGLGLGRLVAGSPERFVPPEPVGSLANNPAAIALQQQIQMNAMETLRRAGIDPTGTAGQLDPITAMLTERLKKAFAGEVSNPVLERAHKKEKEQLANETFLKWGPWGKDLSSPAMEKKVLLDESQAIRTFLDNQNAINSLAPMQGNRIASNLAFQSGMAGLDTLGAQQQAMDQLNQRLAYDAWQAENADRANTARSIAQLFGMVADRAIGGSRRSSQPWDAPMPGLVN